MTKKRAPTQPLEPRVVRSTRSRVYDACSIAGLSTLVLALAYAAVIS